MRITICILLLIVWILAFLILNRQASKKIRKYGEKDLPITDTVESLYVWEGYRRPFENYLFIFTVLLVLLLWLGIETLGFSIKENSLCLDFILNSIWVCVIGILMFLSPSIFCLIFEKEHPIQAEVQWNTASWIKRADNDKDRQWRTEYAKINGFLPPSKKQKIALIAIFWILLFEVFYLTVWTHNGILIWQPNWVNNIIDWMKNHSNTYTTDIGSEIFTITLNKETSYLGKIFSSPKELLESPIGDGLLFLHFTRIFTFPALLFLFSIILWNMVDWVGMERINPKNIKRRFQFVKHIFLFPIVSLFGLSASLMVFFPSMLSFNLAISIEQWLSNLGMYIVFIFLNIIFIKYMQGWFVFINKHF